MNGVKATKNSSKHLYKSHISAAGVRQWVLAPERAGRAMWTQRTDGGLWNCSLSRKNKRPAVGAYRCEGGKRQLEESLEYRAANSRFTPYYPHQYVWPFDPKREPHSSPITINHTCVKVIILKLCVCCCSSSLSLITQKIYNCLSGYCSFFAAAQSNQSNIHEKKFVFLFFDLLQDELFFFLVFVLQQWW